MKRVIAILTMGVLVGSVVAAAQSTSSAQPQSPASTSLVDVAKAEEARRKTVRKPAKVYTNTDLKPDNGTVRPAPPATPPAAEAPSNVTPGVPVVNLPGGTGEEPAKPAGDQAYWSEKINSARAALERSKVLADALQSRINALTTDFVNRDDPAQRAVIENDRKTALAELDRMRKDIDANQKAIAAIEEEARRAGVPAGWLRPSA